GIVFERSQAPDDSPFIQYLKDRITYIGIEDFQALGIETALPLNSIKRRNGHSELVVGLRTSEGPGTRRDHAGGYRPEAV
ncbi:hypothetical protein WG66_010358, partial [Moniliophthora roreri]